MVKRLGDQLARRAMLDIYSIIAPKLAKVSFTRIQKHYRTAFRRPSLSHLMSISARLANQPQFGTPSYGQLLRERTKRESSQVVFHQAVLLPTEEFTNFGYDRSDEIANPFLLGRPPPMDGSPSNGLYVFQDSRGLQLRNRNVGENDG
jgi:hypothetical protein